jgi:molecular chaperone GrpE
MSDDAQKSNEEQLESEQFAAQQETQTEAAAPDPVMDSTTGDTVDFGMLDEPDNHAAELARLESELDETKGQMLRMQAEMQNIQRRARNDVEKAHKFGVERFVKEMLPVLDSLEKAIEACATGEDLPPQVVSLKDGVELTLSMMLAAVKKFEVEVVDPVGKPFDPQFHEAMSMIPRDDVEANSVVAVLQKGYVLNGRLVRPAMVIVAKGP